VTLYRAPSQDELFDPAFLARLDAFTLRLPQTKRGRRLAEQRTSARGQGTDFRDFKPYVAGDDMRTIDWNIYARLGKTFVRVFEEHHDLPVHILIDCSNSMFVEDPPRIAAAARAALAFAAVGLQQQDTVGLHAFADRLTVQARRLSGRTMVARAAHHLARCEPMGGSDLVEAAGRLGAMGERPGLLIVISDFFADGGLDPALDALARMPHRLLLVQAVRDYDADPRLHRDLVEGSDITIESGEGGDPVSVTLTPQLIQRYADSYRVFSDQLARFCLAQGAGLVRLDCARPVIDQLDSLFGTMVHR
jgi:uncharacterized protein (DUF58 family)